MGLVSQRKLRYADDKPWTTASPEGFYYTMYHQITSMSDIVRDLSRLGWTDERIGTELGMDQDEVLRLKQISGLTELFQEEDFSPAWTVS